MHHINYTLLNMKKLLILAMAVLGVQGMQAQSEDFGLFDHMGGGISVGTDGIGFDLATPITDMFALRAGVSFLPAIKVKTDIEINDDGDSNTYYDEIEAQFKLNKFDFKLLFDFYPIKSSSFHLTAGAFIGSSKFINVTNNSPILRKGPGGDHYDPTYDPESEGLKLGNKYVSTDKNGNVDINLKVNGFKPYLGIGFGRAVPKKSRVTASFDLGVQFWGTPGIYALAADNKIDLANGDKREMKFTADDLSDADSEDLKDAFDIMEKITVYPVLNIRLTGRFF